MCSEIIPLSDALMKPPISSKVPKSNKVIQAKNNKLSRRNGVNSSHYTCDVCSEVFKSSKQLRYHIRKTHFNLHAAIPYAQVTEVNQVWFEKVHNSDKIVEIKKTGENSLVLKSVDDNTAVGVNTVDPETIDLSGLYPVLSLTKLECKHCKESYLKKEFKKHVKETHPDKKDQVCIKCSKEFKRLFMYMKHKCDKVT